MHAAAAARARQVAAAVLRWRATHDAEDYLAIPARFTKHRDWVWDHLENPIRYRAANQARSTLRAERVALVRAVSAQRMR